MAHPNDFDSVRLDHFWGSDDPTHTSQHPYQQREASLGSRNTPRWIKLINRGTIRKFLSKWKTNPVQLSSPNDPHNFTSSKLPHLSVCHAESRFEGGSGTTDDLGDGTTISEQDITLRQKRVTYGVNRTLLFLLLGLLLVLVLGGVPVLVTELLSQQDQAPQLHNNTNNINSSTPVPANFSMQTDSTPFSSSIVITSTGTFSESTTSAVNVTYNNETSTISTVTNLTSTSTPDVTSTSSVAPPTLSTSTKHSPSQTTTKMSTEQTTTEISTEQATTATTSDSTVMQTTQDISDVTSSSTAVIPSTTEMNTTVPSSTTESIKEAYAEMTSINYYRVNETSTFSCTVHIQADDSLNITVATINLSKYNDTGKYYVISYDVENNQTLKSDIGARFEVQNVEKHSSILTLTYLLDTEIDIAGPDVCTLKEAYTCEFNVSDSTVQRTFSNTTLELTGVPSEISISTAQNYSLNSNGTVNCSANVLTDDPNHFLDLIIGSHNGSRVMSYTEFRSRSESIEGFPSITLTDQLFGPTRSDCLTRKTVVYEIILDRMYDDIDFSCIAADLSNVNNTQILTNAEVLTIIVT